MHQVESLEVAGSVEAEPDWRVVPAPVRRRWMPQSPAGKLLLASLGVFGVTFLLVAILSTQDGVDGKTCAWLGFYGFGLSAIIALAALVTSLGAAVRGTTGARLSLGMALMSLTMMGIGAFSALATAMAFSRGRQLRRFGRVLLPPVTSSADWVDRRLVLEDAEPAPTGLGQQWRENGRTEHASVASFARLTLDLMALGAPPGLIASANQDALDEIQHTEACFALAHALDGKFESPGPFPDAQRAHTLSRARSLALPQLAVMSLIDGALHEGVSARIIAKLARRCKNKIICGILRQIAADEGRHAAHGWDVVEWCLEQGGSSVAHALAGAVPMLPKQMRSNLPALAQGGAWEAWGIHGKALEDAEYAAARADVTLRAQGLVTRTLARSAASSKTSAAAGAAISDAPS